jgi:hypothetical protein
MQKTLAKLKKMVYNCFKSGDKCNFVVISGENHIKITILSYGEE